MWPAGVAELVTQNVCNSVLDRKPNRMNQSQPSSPWKFVLVGCSALSFLCVVALCGGAIWLFSGPEGGVRLSNEMESYATQYLEEHQILDPDETLIAYYDVTLAMDGTEAAILTTERVVYHQNGQSTSIPLSEITEIRHRKDSLIGDIIEIDSESGIPMKIEIALFNQGESFLNALENARDKSQGAGDPDEDDQDHEA